MVPGTARWICGCASLLLLGACQNEYPIDPTPCDYWCAATERTACGGVDPADCVAACESEYVAACQDDMSAASACVSAIPDVEACRREWSPCERQLEQYWACRSLRDNSAQ